ncbi:MAG: heat-inducible transcriptional repressor HrcA, partial [Chlamydiae bacterium]|nr:heat-inducible transcriptional repressor HrcA [Chlamydiota bacterium]
QAAESLSQITKCAVFQSFPRFDQDFIRDIKLIKLDDKKILSIIITDFGLVKTETLISPKELSNQNVVQIEECFAWMLRNQEKPKVENSIIKLGQHFFNEIMVRYVADYSSFSNEEIYRCGLSHLLNYSEFSDMSILANSLSLFEDKEKMHSILKKCYENNSLSFLIGEDLKRFNVPDQDVAILTIPYHINQITVGGTAILGPIRLPYRKIFGQLNLYSKYVSETLTQTVYKHKITFRQPQDAQVASTYKRSILLEDKTKSKFKE